MEMEIGGDIFFTKFKTNAALIVEQVNLSPSSRRFAGRRSVFFKDLSARRDRICPKTDQNGSGGMDPAVDNL
jgi:hypothetical protein